MNIIPIKDINLGGIADSLFQGVANSAAEIVGLDIHSEPGIIKVNQKMTKESGVVIDDFVTCIVPCSDGNSYLFGSTNGKIWKRTSAGVHSLVTTAAPSAGTVGIFDARQYQGYIYYAMQSRLGRVAVGAPTDWGTRNDDFATFSVTDTDFHPMKEVNQVLYIGDGNLIAQVDAGTFSASALDVKTPLRVKALGKIATDLLFGAFFSAYRVETEIFRWNTWSESYAVSDIVPEININSFLATDNFNLVSAGTKGNIYLYDGASLENFKRIPGDWTGSSEATIHQNASANMFGLPLFGVSNISGNPAKQGIYSLGGYDRNYPRVLNLEHVISTGATEGVDIGFIELLGSELLASWQQTTTVTMTIADPGVITYTAHGLTDGDPISFSTTGALPTGITAGTVYYAHSVSANTLNIYDTSAHAIAGGATGRVATSGTQSGVHDAVIWGIDKLSSSAKAANGYFATRVINGARNQGKTLTGYVGYRTLPTGTTIKVFYKKLYADAWTEATCVVDALRKIVEIKQALPDATVIQVKVELNASENTAPEVEVAEFFFE